MSKKRKSPKDELEREDRYNLELEYSGMKFPREELINVSTNRSRLSSGSDYNLMQQKWGERRKRKYSTLHTHSSNLRRTGSLDLEKYSNDKLSHFEELASIPSEKDLLYFLRDDQARSDTIVSRNPQTGEVIGSITMRKTKRTPNFRGSPVKPSLQYRIDSVFFNPVRKLMGIEPLKNTQWADVDRTRAKKEMKKRLGLYGKSLRESYSLKSPSSARRAFDKLADEFNFQVRHVPKKGYKVNDAGTRFVPEDSGIEKKVGVSLSVLGILGLILTFFPEITGNAVSGISMSEPKLFGVGSFVLLIIGTYLIFQKK